MNAINSIKILLLEWDSNLRYLYQINLKAYLNADVLFAQDHDSAKHEIFQAGKNPIKLIVTRAYKDDVPTAFNIFEYLEFEKIKIPMIVVGFEPRLFKKVSFLQINSLLKNILQLCAKTLNVTSALAASAHIDQYLEIGQSHLNYFQVAPCNLYQKINGKLELSFQENLILDPHDLKDIYEVKKNILLINSNDRLKFANNFSNSLQNFLNEGKLAINDQFRLTDDIGKLVRIEVKKHQEITEIAMELAKTGVLNLMAKVSSASTLVNIIGVGREIGIDPWRLHNIVMAYVGLKYLSTIGNKKNKLNSTSNQKNYLFAILLHDMTLDEHTDRMIFSMEELESRSFDEEKKNKILNHAWDEYSIFIKNDRHLSDVETILLNHHGCPKGKTIGELKYASGLIELSRIFVVVESFCHLVLADERHEEVLNNMPAIHELLRRYKNTKFCDIVNNLANIKEVVGG